MTGMFSRIERASLDLADQRSSLRAECGKMGLDQLRGQGAPFREAESGGNPADNFLEPLMTEQIVQGGRSIRGQADCGDGSEVGLAGGPEDPTNPSQEIVETGEGTLGFLPPERKPLVEELGDERCRGVATEGQHRPPLVGSTALCTM